jgi:hypothetical protein
MKAHHFAIKTYIVCERNSKTPVMVVGLHPLMDGTIDSPVSTDEDSTQAQRRMAHTVATRMTMVGHLHGTFDYNSGQSMVWHLVGANQPVAEIWVETC